MHQIAPLSNLHARLSPCRKLRHRYRPTLDTQTHILKGSASIWPLDAPIKYPSLTAALSSGLMYSLCFSPDSLDTLRRVRIWRLFAWCLLSFALSLLPRLRKLGETTADVSGFAFSPAHSTVLGTEKMPGIYLLSAQSNAVFPQTRGGKGMAFVQSEGFTPGSAELPPGSCWRGKKWRSVLDPVPSASRRPPLIRRPQFRLRGKV